MRDRSGFFLIPLQWVYQRKKTHYLPKDKGSVKPEILSTRIKMQSVELKIGKRGNFLFSQALSRCHILHELNRIYVHLKHSRLKQFSRPAQPGVNSCGPALIDMSFSCHVLQISPQHLRSDDLTIKKFWLFSLFVEILGHETSENFLSTWLDHVRCFDVAYMTTLRNHTISSQNGSVLLNERDVHAFQQFDKILKIFLEADNFPKFI